MDHLAEPLEALRGRALSWLRDQRARVLAVPADPELGEGARALLASLEWAPDNRRPFFVLTRDGWGARAHELRELYEARRAAFEREAGAPVAPRLPALPGSLAASAPGVEPVAVFARELMAVARVFEDDEDGDDEALGTRGVVVVVASAALEPRLEARSLAAAPGLENVRWIWLDVAHAGADAAAGDVQTPGEPAVWTAPCRIDRDAQDRETGDLLAAAIAAVASGTGGPPGGARPSLAPPPHPGDPGAVQKGGVSGAGVPAAPAPPPHLHPMLLGVQALRASNLELAMQHLREARDAAAGAGADAEAVEMEIMLASTGARLALARKASFGQVAALFEAAAGRAERAELLGAAAKARFLLGMCGGAAGEIETAARALLAAAELAGRSGDPALRFHALRAAGDLAARASLRARAAELWREALDVVKQADPALAQATGLLEAAGEIERALRGPAAPAAGARLARVEDVAP